MSRPPTAIPTISGTLRPRTTVRSLQAKRDRGERITMLTAYDYPSARLVDQAGIDAILVGDSLAMVVLGHEDTLSVTMEEMLHHCRAVSRGARSALLIGDMPFMSYQADIAEAVRNAGRFLQEGRMNAVKIEGGQEYAETVRAMVRAGIPVLGHIGLTPQSVNLLGGWLVQGKTADAAQKLRRDALALQDAGCFAVVLESIPDRLAARITEELRIPTIGIGAGPHCSGQVLVYHDLLGLFDRFTPKFVRRYAEIGQAILAAIQAYRADVEAGAFPAAEHSYGLLDEEWQAFLAAVSANPAAAGEQAEAVLASGGEARAKETSALVPPKVVADQVRARSRPKAPARARAAAQASQPTIKAG